MAKKTRYNPSGHPVIQKSSNNKGSMIKGLEQYRKRLNKLLARKGK